MTPGDRLILTVEKPAAGGRMIARHADTIVLVSAAIPGEVVEAEVEKVQRHTCWARTVRVLEASPDRVEAGDWACGGNVFSHIAYPRQCGLKREIIEDAFRRIARMALPADLEVAASTPSGYRMRARLHVVNGRIGFLREGTHQLCDASAARQLLPESSEILRALETTLERVAGEVEAIELAENCQASERAVHFTLRDGSDPSLFGSLPPIDSLRGASFGAGERMRSVTIWGDPTVSDTLSLGSHDSAPLQFTLRRHARSFFQANRFLLAPLVAAVLDAVQGGHVLDLYAGVGLFSVAIATRGQRVVAIEGDRHAARDLKGNAARVQNLATRHQDVEGYLGRRGLETFDTVIVDPPRTGMTKTALTGVLDHQPSRIVYVSCDVATLARDARLIADRGYHLTSARAFDLFPNTAHVETLVTFDARP
jgi:23S rRNA (uracil1939-C5)-methyltransferase